MKGVVARKTGQAGHGIGGRIYFWAASPTTLPNAKIGELQTELGYDPCGYDGPWGIEGRIGQGGKVEYTWSCAASCD